MSDILLDYVFRVNANTPIPAANIAYIRTPVVICKPSGAGTPGYYTINTAEELAIQTDNTSCLKLLGVSGGKISSFKLITSDTLDIADLVNSHLSDFYTILVSDDFTKEEVGNGTSVGAFASIKIQDVTYTAVTKGVAGNSITITYEDTGTAGAETVTVVGSDITVSMEEGVSTANQIAVKINSDLDSSALIAGVVDAGDEGDVQDAVTIQTLTGGVEPVGINYGLFTGVVGFSIQEDPTPATDTENREWLAIFAITECGFYGHPENFFEAFGKLLGSTNWKNRQYDTMPQTGVDEIDGLGKAENLFDDRVSFVITSGQYGNKLSFFATGGQAIVAPYVVEEIKNLLQGNALTWINTNQPNYTITQATLLEEYLVKVFDPYISNDIIETGVVDIRLESNNFVAQGTITVSEPRALWKVVNELYQI